MSRVGRVALLVVLAVTTASTVAVSNAHYSRHWAGQHQVNPNPSPPSAEQTPSPQQGQGAETHMLVCPSNMRDILLSKENDIDALTGEDMPLSSLRHCPLYNSPIFHNHPAGRSLADRLLIYISHRLRDHRISYGLEESQISEWLFFLPPSSITTQLLASIPDLPAPIASTSLEGVHLILLAPEKPEPTTDARQQQYQQPLVPLEALHHDYHQSIQIIAIRISALSKAFIERALALQQQDAHPQLIENDALASAATEYEFADSVKVLMSTLAP